MGTIKPKKLVKELEKQLRLQQDSLVLRLKLAAAYREVGRRDDAVELYRSVAVAYHQQGRLAQAIAVCRSVLEIEPSQRETQVLLAELDRLKSMLQTPAPPSDVPSLAGARPAAPDQQRHPAVPSMHDPVPLASSLAPPSVEGGQPRRGRRSQAPPPPKAPEPVSRAALAEPPHERPRPPTRDEFAINSGLTPHSNPGLGPYRTRPGERTRPSVPARTTPADLSRSAQSGPFAEGGRDRRSRRSTGLNRSSASMNTPTPLPIPLALHEAVPDDSMDDILLGARRTPTQHNRQRAGDDDEMPTRIADDPAELLRRARLATPPPLPRAPTPPPIPPRRAAPPISRQVSPQATRQVVRGGFDDEAPTRIAGGDAWPEGEEGRMPAREARHDTSDPGIETVRRNRGDETVTHAEEPIAAASPVSAHSLNLPDELMPFQRSRRLLDVEPAWTDETTSSRNQGGSGDGDAEATRVQDEAVQRPSDTHLTARDSAPTDVKATPKRPPPERDADSALELSQAFNRGFGEAMEGIGPDGSALEGPLEIFAELPEAALAALARGMKTRQFKRGDVVVREGELGDACYIVATGEVRVLKLRHAGGKATHVELARLGEGALFGEFALLGDRKRHATVQVTVDCDLHEISREVLDDLARRHRDVTPALEQIYRRRLLATLLSTAPFFQPLAAERRAEFLARFHPVRCESGEQIIREGERAGGLYLILLGSVEITRRTAPTRSVILASLQEGAYFGEMSLLKGDVASASVTAIGPVELAVLPPREFYGLMSEHPNLWTELRQEAHRRTLATSDILSDEAGAV